MSRFWRTLPGTLAVVLILGLVVCVGAVGILVHRVTHPARETQAALDVGAMLAGVEDVSFRSADGIELRGWLIRGRPDAPAIILCHDLGSSRGALVNLAIPLHEAGFTLLAFDFRAHGESRGSTSTLGLDEKRDVLGAVDYLASLKGVDSRDVGIYGVGIGAHAATLAAADRPAVRVLVLDGLYPDAAYPLVRRTYQEWSFGVRHLGFLPKWVFSAMVRSGIDRERAAAVLPGLRERDILLVAPAGDSGLASAMQRLYESIPLRRGTESSLVTLPATRAGNLYGAESERYTKRIAEFFASRLVRR